MDAYNIINPAAPAGGCSTYKPYRAVCLPWLVATVLYTIVGYFELQIFPAIIGVPFTDMATLYYAMGKSVWFLVIDLCFLSFIMMDAGTLIHKYVPGKEIKFSIMVAALLIIKDLPAAIIFDTRAVYPGWYNVFSLVVVVVGLIYGSKFYRVKLDKNHSAGN